MRYTKFEIENYKGIKNKLILDLTKLPSPNIFTLVGLNESGKTSILEAINLLQKSLPGDKAHTMIHKSKQGNFNGEISVCATIELNEEDENNIQHWCKDNLASYILADRIKTVHMKTYYEFENSKYVNSGTILKFPCLVKTSNKSKNSKELVDVDEALWNKLNVFIKTMIPKILYYENFLFDFPSKIYLENSGGNNCLTQVELEYKDVIQDVLDSFGENLTIENHILSRLKSDTDEDKEALDAILTGMSEKLTEVIFSSWDEVFSKTTNKARREIEVTHGKDDQKGYYLQLKIKQGKSKFAITERSLGFKWFFSFLLFIKFRKERRNESGETLFLLDEPANNLHQKSQSKLLGVFEKLSKDCKIIYSTHSDHLINPKFLSGTYIIRNSAINYDEEDEFNTTDTSVTATLYKNFVSNYPNETDHFRPILDAIDYIPGDLSLAEKIICVEGKNDYYTFKYMMQYTKCNNADMHFYPGAGVNSYSTIFTLYLSWGKDFIVIFDADSTGKKAIDDYIEEKSIELESKLFTLASIEKGWDGWTTEKLFTEDDQMRIIRSLFPDTTQFNKSQFNTAIQNLYINNTKLFFSMETIERFEKIYSFIKNKL